VILDGKKVALKIRAEVKEEVSRLKAQNPALSPKLCVVMVGDYPPSQVYVRNKIKACEEVGIESKKVVLPETIMESQLVQEIDKLNQSSDVDGILVQFPLPKPLSQSCVLESISYKKDVDGFSYSNLGRLMAGHPLVEPCTPAGIMRLLDEYQISIEGKKAVVVGRSLIVGKPMAQLLTQRHATVTLAHSKTQNLSDLTSQADICIFAAHQPRFFGRQYVKKGSVVIDVGIHTDQNGKIHGDTKFEELEDWAAYITPVPGGVGPLTIAMLLKNTVTLFKKFRLNHVNG
jgi:methylenetetrahydrofolate dehydrogenase (NADP+)/methenyltetrahydrofolate cyclohydrolase